MNYSKLQIKFKVCNLIPCLKINKRSKEKQVLLGLQNIFYLSKLMQKFREYGIIALYILSVIIFYKGKMMHAHLLPYDIINHKYSFFFLKCDYPRLRGI